MELFFMKIDTLRKLLEEWRKIHETNFMIVQQAKPSIDLKPSPYDVQKSMRAKEIAQVLEPHLKKLELLPREEFEIMQDLK